jgi:hypothetical protein
VDASAKAVMPIEDMFYGDGTGQVQESIWIQMDDRYSQRR